MQTGLAHRDEPGLLAARRVLGQLRQRDEPELGHLREPGAQLARQQVSVEALQPHEVGADQHQPDVGARAERRRPVRLVRLLGHELVDERGRVRELDRSAAVAGDAEEQVKDAPALGRDDGLHGLAHAIVTSSHR